MSDLEKFLEENNVPKQLRDAFRVFWQEHRDGIHEPFPWQSSPVALREEPSEEEATLVVGSDKTQTSRSQRRAQPSQQEPSEPSWLGR